MWAVLVTDHAAEAGAGGGEVVLELLTMADMPKSDAYGRRMRLELCKTCDADNPAAAAVIGFFTTGGGHDIVNIS